MGEISLNVKHILSNDSTENWKSQNPLLKPGEIIYDKTKKDLKINYNDQDTNFKDLDYLQNKNIKAARLVIGTSTNGWTDTDCNYLCDGTSDEIEIKAAIEALSDTGGEIIILDGIYNLSESLSIGTNISLIGNGSSTVLNQKSSAIFNTNLISLNGNYSTIKNFAINSSTSTGPSSIGIAVLGTNCIVEGIVFLTDSFSQNITGNGNRAIVTNNYFTQALNYDTSSWVFNNNIIAGNISYNKTNNTKSAKIVIGTSQNGYTKYDCDYLCDGIADNVEINQAIQSLPDTGGEIIILNGTYNITNSIVVFKSNVVLRGNGNSTKIIRSNTSPKNTKIFSIGNNHNNITIKDLSLDGTVNNNSSTDNCGIYVTTCDYFLLENVFLNGFKFSDTEDGIGVRIEYSDNARISNCNIINTATCLSLYYIIDFKIENNIFVSSLKNTKSTLLFSLPSYNPYWGTYGIITNNSINCSGGGVQFNTIAGTTDGKVIISNNHFNTSVDYEPEGSGPFISSAPIATNLIITGNTFKDNWTTSFVGIECSGDYWNISNNTFSDLGIASIISGSNNLFLNNIIKNCDSTCNSSGTNNVISNNKITSSYSSSNISRSGENNFSLNNVFGDGRFDTQTTIQYPYLNNIPWYTGNTMSTYAFAKACPSYCNFVTTINKEHHFSDSPLGASMYGIMHVYCGSANYRDFIIYRVGGANIYFGSMNGNGTAVTWRQITLTNI